MWKPRRRFTGLSAPGGQLPARCPIAGAYALPLKSTRSWAPDQQRPNDSEPGFGVLHTSYVVPLLVIGRVPDMPCALIGAEGRHRWLKLECLDHTKYDRGYDK